MCVNVGVRTQAGQDLAFVNQDYRAGGNTPWLLAVNGTGNRMGRSTASACANCNCNCSLDSLKAGRSKTTTPSARSPGARRRVVRRYSEMATGSALIRLFPLPRPVPLSSTCGGSSSIVRFELLRIGKTKNCLVVALHRCSDGGS